jgi:hypothetical protein
LEFDVPVPIPTAAVASLKGHPIAALLLARQLMALKQSLHSHKGISAAMAALELTIDANFTHTDFYKVSHNLYLRRLKGIIKPKKKNSAVGSEAMKHLLIYPDRDTL